MTWRCTESWCLITPDNVSSGWLVFGVWLVGWSVLEHADLKQVRSGRLIGNKQQPSSLAEPETDDCKV